MIKTDETCVFANKNLQTIQHIHPLGTSKLIFIWSPSVWISTSGSSSSQAAMTAPGDETESLMKSSLKFQTFTSISQKYHFYMYLSYFPLLPKGVCYHPIGVGHHKHWDQVLMGQKHISINPFISILIFDSWILNIDYSEHLYKEHGGIIDCLYHIVLLLFLEALWISLRIIIWHLVENLVNKREGQYIKFSRTLCFVKSRAL